MAKLEISNLSKRFGQTEALRDINLDIQSGEFICLLGASGCGKTTLLRLIAGLTPHDRGEIRLAGSDLSAVPCHKRNIGMVFQSLALFPHLNVGQNIAYGQRLRGVPASEMARNTEDLLTMVGLSGLAERPIAALSGGQRQRVAIARALALRPSVFLMDEPFSALDAGLRDQMQIEVKRIQREFGVTTIFVTHDQREAMALADRIVVMNGGIIEQAAAPDTLYAQPQTRFVADFIGTNNLLEVDINAGAARIANTEIGAPQGPLRTLTGTHTIAIRPEAIELTTPDSPNTLTGAITAQRRLGAVLEREIDVNGAALYQYAFSGNGPSFDQGAQVALRWDWDQVWVIPK